MTEQIYDLEALAEALRTDNAHPALTESIQRCADVGSAHQDICQAIECLEALSVFAGARPIYNLPSDLSGTLAGSLMVSAIVFYARATDTDPIKGERRKWFGDGKLDGINREIHKEVIKLRNRHVAHFGRSAAIDGDILIEETTVYRPHDPTHLIGFIAARIHNKAAFSARFAGLAIDVRALAERAAMHAFKETRTALRTALGSDPLLAGAIERFAVTNPRLLDIDANPIGEWTEGPDARRYSGTVQGA